MNGTRSGVNEIGSGSTYHLEAQLVEMNKQLQILLNRGHGVARETSSYYDELGHMTMDCSHVHGAKKKN